MANMVGEGILPESVNRRRRSLRQRVSSVREPLRSRRQSAVPGPDVIGRVEEQVRNVESRVSGREGIVDRIRNRQSSSGGIVEKLPIGDGSNMGGSMSSGSSGSSGSGSNGQNGGSQENEAVPRAASSDADSRFQL